MTPNFPKHTKRLDMSAVPGTCLLADSLCYLTDDIIEWALDDHNRDILEQVAEGVWTRLSPPQFAQWIRKQHHETHADVCSDTDHSVRHDSLGGIPDALSVQLPIDMDREVVSVQGG